MPRRTLFSLGAQPVRVVRARGFTLLEILIALAILALLGSALAKQTSSSAVIYSHIQDREAALSLAENTLEEIQLAEPPAMGESSSLRQAGDQQFTVTTVVERTARPDMSKILVSVHTAPDSIGRGVNEPLIQLQAFVGLN